MIKNSILSYSKFQDYKISSLKEYKSMQENTKSSICVRLTPKCRESVQLVTKNGPFTKQIRLINRISNNFIPYEFEQIYGKEITNQVLYESFILNQQTKNILDLESALFCFLGSQGVGKTQTVIGQLHNLSQNPGLLGYLMQDLFSKLLQIPSQSQLSSSRSDSNALELRFVQVLGENVENISFETVYGESANQRQLADCIDYKIQIKSLAHFKNCIHKIYERKKPQMHSIIEVTLNNESDICASKKTIFTFIQLSSIYFDEGNVNSPKIKSQVEALITIFQNIERIKHLEHLFESCKLSKLLKNNFFEAKKTKIVGILDNSFKGNNMTLNCLKMSLQFKQDRKIIESMREDIKKQEDYLKSLMEKNKKAMNLLSKCIGTQLSFLDKQKNFANSKRHIDFGFGNSFNRRCQKIKVANLKKQLNEEQIQKLNKEIAAIEQEMDLIDLEHKDSMKKLQQQMNEIITAKNKLVAKMEEMTQQLLYKNSFNGNTNTNNSENSLFWRPTFDFQNSTNLPHDDKKGQKEYEGTSKKQNTSRNSLFKISTNKINNLTKPLKSTAMITPSITKIKRKKLNQNDNQQNFLLQIKRQKSIIKQQTKRQIYELFKLISQQQKCLQNALNHHPQKISSRLTNRIKNRENKQLKNLLKQTINTYLKEGKQFQLQKYKDLIQNQKIFIQISKDLLLKQKKPTEKTIPANV